MTSCQHENLWLTKKALATRLGVSIGLVTKLVCQEGMPHLKLGRRIKFNYEAVLAWLERRGNLRR